MAHSLNPSPPSPLSVRREKISGSLGLLTVAVAGPRIRRRFVRTPSSCRRSLFCRSDFARISPRRRRSACSSVFVEALLVHSRHRARSWSFQLISPRGDPCGSPPAGRRAVAGSVSDTSNNLLRLLLSLSPSAYVSSTRGGEETGFHKKEQYYPVSFGVQGFSRPLQSDPRSFQ